MFYTYILYSESFDKYYVGQTNNIEDRLYRHNNGENQATKPFKPWVLKLKIECETRSEAVRLEKKLKNLSKIRLQEFIDKTINIQIKK